MPVRELIRPLGPNGDLESFKGVDHLRQVQVAAKELVDKSLS